MNLKFDVGELGRPAEVEFESAATALVENNQIKSLLQPKYSLDKQEITNAKMENARGILIYPFLSGTGLMPDRNKELSLCLGPRLFPHQQILIKNPAAHIRAHDLNL